MQKILFVCTGNYYRSRFAEIYFNFKSESSNSKWSAFSRGFDLSNPDNTGSISNHVLEKLIELKISLPENFALPTLLNESDLLQAEKIIALNEKEHKPFVKKYFPEWEHKFIFWNIHDLYEEQAASSLIELKKQLDKLISETL